MKWKEWYHPFISFIFSSSQKSTVWVIHAFFVVTDMMLEEPTTRMGLWLLASLITIVVILASLITYNPPTYTPFSKQPIAAFIWTEQKSSLPAQSPILKLQQAICSLQFEDSCQTAWCRKFNHPSESIYLFRQSKKLLPPISSLFAYLLKDLQAYLLFTCWLGINQN